MNSKQLSEKRPISFMLNGSVITISPDQPDTTLLNWLRQSQHLTGSKEGCAEGDCGACSVIISRIRQNGTVSHDAANACILLLPMLDGIVLTTVEYIAGPDGMLHPVQQAMVDHHGSQCGFCTPGFVVSLVAGWRQGFSQSMSLSTAWKRQDIEDLIAGNLCRCTGYGPIIKAAESLANQQTQSRAIPSWESDRLLQEKDWLEQHNVHSLITETDRPFIAPDDINTLSQLILDNPDKQIIAGATDIGLWVTKKHQIMSGFISVMRVPELNQITENEIGFTIGCGVNHADAMAELGDDFPQLNELWRRFGSRQVRASGTVCGNIANGSPIGDLPPAFLALGASLTIRHGNDERCLPLDQFYHDYMVNDLKEGEWVKSVTLPKIKANQHVMIHKISRRFDQDISAVMGAFSYDITDGKITAATIGFGGMAAIPKRAHVVEQALIGQQIDTPVSQKILDLIAQDFTPIDDVRASAEYRLHVATMLLSRSVQSSETMTPKLAGSEIHVLSWEGSGEGATE